MPESFFGNRSSNISVCAQLRQRGLKGYHLTRNDFRSGAFYNLLLKKITYEPYPGRDEQNRRQNFNAHPPVFDIILKLKLYKHKPAQTCKF